MVFPRKVSIKKGTKKFNIASFFDWNITNIYIDSFRKRILRGSKNNIVCFINAHCADMKQSSCKGIANKI